MNNHGNNHGNINGDNNRNNGGNNHGKFMGTIVGIIMGIIMGIIVGITMENSWEYHRNNHGNIMGISWEYHGNDHGNIMGTIMGIIMGTSWGYHRNIMGIIMGIMGISILNGDFSIGMLIHQRASPVKVDIDVENGPFIGEFTYKIWLVVWNHMQIHYRTIRIYVMLFEFSSIGNHPTFPRRNITWLVVWNMIFFHSVGNVWECHVIPTDEVHHFSEG